jgi:hypothetical protein
LLQSEFFFTASQQTSNPFLIVFLFFFLSVLAYHHWASNHMEPKDLSQITNHSLKVQHEDGIVASVVARLISKISKVCTAQISISHSKYPNSQNQNTQKLLRDLLSISFSITKIILFVLRNI